MSESEPRAGGGMQRLFRGRMLYLALALLSVVLYWRISRLPASHEPAGAEAVHAVAPAPVVDMAQYQWWPAAHDADSLRKIFAEEPFIGLLMISFLFFAAGLAIGGLLFTAYGLWTGKIRAVWQFPARRLPPWTFNEMVRVLILAVLVASLLPFVRLGLAGLWRGVEPDLNLWMTFSMLVLDSFVIMAVIVFAQNKRGVRGAFGLSLGRMSEAISTGFRGYVAVFPWLFLLLAIIVEVSRRMGLKPPVEPIQQLLFQEQRPHVLGMTIVLACIVGPIAEEFFFRGVLYGALRQRLSRLFAILVSGALFSLLHTSPIGFLPIMLLGCLLAYLYERTGSLASPLSVHIIHNTFLMSLSLMFRQLPNG